ncbi:MAG: neutral/alkaline non-lysosomal ceramidase N-terminal domain-containing protein [Thermoanaerobaculia bacterium]|nr:neutral/alkaline non-lysosomal ceramidase N-terminal domain-containing protein [Thermoanaerobaculia bacterium]
MGDARTTVGTGAVLVLAACLGALSAPAVRAELEVGVAKADITPPVGGAMYGYGARGDNVATGVHDRLWAKALVARAGGTSVAFVTLDLGAFEKDRTQRVKDAVRRETGIENLVLVASHTHSAPTYQPDFPDAERPYAAAAEAAIAGAVAEAAAGLRPARFAVGWGRVEEGHNRRLRLPDGSIEMLWGNRERRPTSPVDYALGVVAFRTLAGEPLATWIGFQCHPVVLGPENLEISADYPGVMTARVDAEIGGVAMFLQGAAGDINPFWDKTPPAEGGFEQVAAMGEKLADEVVRVVRRMPPAGDVASISFRSREVPLAPRWDLDDPAVEAAFRANEFGWIFDRYRARFARESRAEVTTTLFGDRLALASFPGEFFVEHGLRLRQQSLVPDTLFVGYANGALAYFPTLRAAAEGAYGGKEATLVEVGAGEKLVSLALEALHRQLGKLSDVPTFD